MEVIGGSAIPVLEGWILAMLGETKTETLSKAAACSQLAAKSSVSKDTAAMVRNAETFAIDGLPSDAVGLRRWLETAADVLHGLVNGTAVP
jgi:hypothetical protein